MDSQDAVRRVYGASYRRLVVQLLAVGADQAEAEDAVQEAFVKAIGLRRRFGRPDNPEGTVKSRLARAREQLSVLLCEVEEREHA